MIKLKDQLDKKVQINQAKYLRSRNNPEVKLSKKVNYAWKKLKKVFLSKSKNLSKGKNSSIRLELIWLMHSGFLLYKVQREDKLDTFHEILQSVDKCFHIGKGIEIQSKDELDKFLEKLSIIVKDEGLFLYKPNDTYKNRIVSTCFFSDVGVTNSFKLCAVIQYGEMSS